MLSGCRKAPILAVGINPNLPGWWPTQSAALNPLFDDYRQYAHYFRYRKAAKPELTPEDYTAYGGGPTDVPPESKFLLQVPIDSQGKPSINIQWREQKMYLAYAALLEDIAREMGWPTGRLSVGEDLVYGNMVACPSAKWTTKTDPNNPRLIPMTDAERQGIVAECFKKRRYFLRQLFQSLPKVILVFSQNTARAFLGELSGHFSSGNPRIDDDIASLMKETIILHFGDKSDGNPLDARVIFGPHPTGDPDAWREARPIVLESLIQTAKTDRLVYNSITKRLARTEGNCTFCTMLEIGPCGYEQELAPLATPPRLAAKGMPTWFAEKPLQMEMLERFLASAASFEDAWKHSDDP
jgi:hypothetical protein